MSKKTSLKAAPRLRTGSGRLNQMRREGWIPSVIYGKGTTNLNLHGGASNDIFNVTPSATTTFLIDGDTPTPPTSSGDELNVDLSGTINPVLTASDSPSGFSGSFTSDNRKPVNFQEIENLSPGVDLVNTSTPGADTRVASTS